MTAEGTQLPSQTRDRIARAIAHQVLMPFLGAAIGVAYATGRWDLSAVGTGLAVTGALALFWKLDRSFIQPQLQRIPQDWLRLETEMVISLAGHLVGAFAALLACGRLFGFSVKPGASWLLLGGIVLAFPVLHGAEMGLRYYRQLRDKERTEQELRALATEAELRALKAQMSPHFLFNALNTIAALIHTHPELAEASVERLAGMFRYVLSGSDRRRVSLEEELAFANDYLEIERARFGERLQVTLEVDPRALSVPAPSLILQPLVENAVRHGQGDDGAIDVDIRVACDGDEVTVTIADRGPGMPAGYHIGDGPGYGLRNVDDRLRKMYGRGLAIGRNETRGTVVVARFPTAAATSTVPSTTSDKPPLSASSAVWRR